jgi:hypothetical protein
MATMAEVWAADETEGAVKEAETMLRAAVSSEGKWRRRM